MLGSCTSNQAIPALRPMAISAREIVYVSSDQDRVAIFTPETARFGENPLAFSAAIWPSATARYFDTADGVQCVSVGPLAHAEDFAIKRPLRDGETYQCLATSFRVTRCFQGCRAAVIERVSTLGGNDNGTLKTYMYVNDCLGVLILSLRPNADFEEGIPLDAEWLRGSVGILPHRDYPRCTPF